MTQPLEQVHATLAGAESFCTFCGMPMEGADQHGVMDEVPDADDQYWVRCYRVRPTWLDCISTAVDESGYGHGV